MKKTLGIVLVLITWPASSVLSATDPHGVLQYWSIGVLIISDCGLQIAESHSFKLVQSEIFNPKSTIAKAPPLHRHQTNA